MVEFLASGLVQVCTHDGYMVQCGTFVKAVSKIAKRLKTARRKK